MATRADWQGELEIAWIPLSISFNAVLVPWCEQKDLVLASADNQVKMVKHIASKDA